ncbi:M14 family zinc carboxypeptidase [Cohnella hongkongensis]|uniref:M14 family zinc carboxypeptidase n=1 Tax=Cohnella hongkongensis TaxID=178337 RepID=A0ABV9FGH2_9BACL
MSCFKRCSIRLNLILLFSLCLTAFASALDPRDAAAAEAMSSPIVNPKQIYSYSVMTRDLKALAARYPGLIKLGSAGVSEYGRELWTADIGRGPAVILVLGSHHAREWVTTINSMMQLETIARQSGQGSSVYGGYRAGDLLDRVTFRFVPMVNPDGVTLQQSGLAAFPTEARASLVEMNGGSRNFKRWKANGKGIDLNRSYPADWDHIHNPGSGPSYMNYKGKQPLQAKEAQAIYDLTLASEPEIAVAYHSSGEILYWNFKTDPDNVKRDRAIAVAYSAMTGYRLFEPLANPSGGGFTDWFIQEFGRPGLTPELGRSAGPTNVPLSEWDRIWNQQKDTLWMLAREGYSLWLERQPVSELSEEVRLTRAEPGFRYPDMRSKREALLYPGRYPALRQKGDWVQISSSNGVVWVASGHALIGPFEKLEGRGVAVGPETEAYSSPIADRPEEAKLESQTAVGLERWRNWLLIRAAEGIFWIQEPPEPEPDLDAEPEPSEGGTGTEAEDERPGSNGADA